jgi:vacuolar iron transporter family protein
MATIPHPFPGRALSSPAAPAAAPTAPTAAHLNWLRAGVLGANDGIVSVAAVVVGVAGATSSTTAIVTAGLAALVGGAVSMALGEYVSVSSARDSQLASRAELRDDDVANPWHAGGASAVAFVAGALLPFLTVVLVAGPARIPATVVATLLALALTGGVGARLGQAPVRRAVVRVVLGGAIALGLTFAVGTLFGTQIL